MTTKALERFFECDDEYDARTLAEKYYERRPKAAAESKEMERQVEQANWFRSQIDKDETWKTIAELKQMKVALVKDVTAWDALEKLANDAASETVLLRLQLAQTQEALEPFANAGMLPNDFSLPDEVMVSQVQYTDCKHAAAVLAKVKK